MAAALNASNSLQELLPWNVTPHLDVNDVDSRPEGHFLSADFVAMRDESQAYRWQAVEHRQERDALLARSLDAREQGFLLASAYYSQVAGIHHEAMLEANQRAAGLIASFVNKRHLLTPETTLDLHFLHVKEALALLKHFLERERSRRIRGDEERHLVVVTGRGAHSGGPPRVKDAVIKFLQQHNIPFTQQNPGRLLLTLS